MELYILRHGIAEDGSGKRDKDRELTSGGRDELCGMLRLAARARIQPSLMLTSPLIRAVQTAEIAARELGYKGELVETDTLIPEADPWELWRELRVRDERAVLLASHNPLCSRLPGFLLSSPSMQVHFDKGAMVRIDLDRLGAEPRGVLRWMLTPRFAQ